MLFKGVIIVLSICAQQRLRELDGGTTWLETLKISTLYHDWQSVILNKHLLQSYLMCVFCYEVAFSTRMLMISTAVQTVPVPETCSLN